MGASLVQSEAGTQNCLPVPGSHERTGLAVSSWEVAERLLDFVHVESVIRRTWLLSTAAP